MHEMQPLCPPCHLKKTAAENTGAKIRKMFDTTRYGLGQFQPRKHQQQFIDLLSDWVNLRRGKVISLFGSPGVGKSAIPRIEAQLIELGIVDSICWVVPRGNLKLQGAQDFNDGQWNPSYWAQCADGSAPIINQSDMGPPANRRCFTTTYQAIAANPDLYRHWFDSHKTALILDEVHHLALESGEKSAAWTDAVSPLVDKCVHLVLMTGTPERHDGKMIPFLTYEGGEDGVFRPQLDIRYSRREAVRDRAKLEIEIYYCGGSAEYVDSEGLCKVDISEAHEKQNGKVVRACLSDKGEYAPGVMTKALEGWLSYRRSSGYLSKMIIVCDKQLSVKRNVKWLQENYPYLKIAQAISDDGDESKKQIARFKKHCASGGADVLLTVGMAYEGLDVPSVTDIVGLTHIRSKPWFEQCLDRCSRVDYSSGIDYDQQRAVAWIMDDPRMQEIAEAIQAEQIQGVQEREEEAPRGGSGSGEDEQKNSDRNLLVLDSEHKNVRIGSTKEDLTKEESGFIKACRKRYPYLSSVRNDALLRMRADGQFPGIEPEQATPSIASKEEDLASYLRNPEARELIGKRIDVLTRKYAQLVAPLGGSPDWSAGNRAIKERFDVPRKQMSIPQLYDAMLYSKELVAKAFQRRSA